VFKKRHKKALKVSFALILSVLFITFAWTMTKACSEGGVQCTLVQDFPDSLVLDETYEMVVDCRNADTVPYDVWAVITIYGPSREMFTNDDVFINWVSYDERGDVVSNFTLGRNLWNWGAHMDFTQVNGNVINWIGTPTRMNPGVYRRHMLYASILGSAPLGNFRVAAEVLGETPPIEAKVSITPKTLNVESEGQWIQAQIRLPAPYNVKDIDINSVKLEYKDSDVQAEWNAPQAILCWSNFHEAK